DELACLLEAEPRAALGRVHCLRKRESVRPEMLAEPHGGFPVDGAVRECGHVRGSVDAARHGWGIGKLPAGLGDLERSRTAWQRYLCRHLSSPAGKRALDGPLPRTATLARPVERPWRPRSGPNGTACPPLPPSGTAPTAL